MLSLVLALSVGQMYVFPPESPWLDECTRMGGRCSDDRTGWRPMGGYAFFEFAPTSGAGMGAECACASVTGAKGEALTYSRTGTAACTIGHTTSGIDNGDVVLCAANQPRVMRGGDGTGTVGLLVEGTRTNSMTRSAEFDNAAWTKYSFGSGSVPTVTANYAVAPDGTTTAERVQFSAVNAGDQSAILQASGITTGSNTVSVYVRGTSGSGSICVQAYISGGGYTECSYVSTSWTRCKYTGTVTSSGQMRIGNDSATCGGGSRTAQDVLLWGAQWEADAYPTSYIPTTTAAAVRGVEQPTVAGVTVPLAGSAAASMAYTGSDTATGNHTVIDALLGTASGWRLSYISSNLRHEKYTPGVAVQAARTWSAGDSRRWASSFNGTDTTLYQDGVSFVGPTAQTAATAPPYTPLGLGWDHQGFAGFGGVISRVCIDPSPSRCR